MPDTADDTETPPIVYRPDGTIDLTMPAGKLTLPRPTFGQIKTLIRAHGALAEDLKVITNRASAVSAEILTETEAMAEADPAKRVARLDTLDRLGDLNLRARQAADEAETATQDLLAAWWVKVFDTLIPEVTDRPAEDEWPAFFLDSRLATHMINHWRFVPTGPG